MWLSRAPLFQACFGTSWRVGDDPRVAPLMSLSTREGDLRVPARGRVSHGNGYQLNPPAATA